MLHEDFHHVQAPAFDSFCQGTVLLLLSQLVPCEQLDQAVKAGFDRGEEGVFLTARSVTIDLPAVF